MLALGRTTIEKGNHRREEKATPQDELRKERKRWREDENERKIEAKQRPESKAD